MKLSYFVEFMSIEEIIDFYARMALTPGWLDHARHRSKELEKVYPGISKMIAERIKELNESL